MTLRRVVSAAVAAAILVGMLLGIGALGEEVAPVAAQSDLEAYRLADRWTSSVAPNPPGLIAEPGDVLVLPGGGAAVLDTVHAQVHFFDGNDWTGAFADPDHLAAPTGLAFMSQRLVIADRDAGLHIYELDGTYVRTIGGVGRPIDVAATSDRLIVADAANRVLVLDAGGTRLATHTGDGLPLSDIVAVDAFADGQMVVLDNGGRRVRQWSASGDEQSVISSQESLPWVDVAVTSDTTFAIAGLRLLSHYTTAGQRFAAAQGPVPGGFTAVDGADAPDAFSLWAGVRQDYMTGLYHFEDTRLVAPGWTFGLPGAPGQFESPRRIEAASDLIYVVDAWPRIQRLRLDGSPVDQWEVEAVQDIDVVGGRTFVAGGTSLRQILDGTGPLWAWSALTDTLWFSGLAFSDQTDSLYTLELKSQRLYEVNDEGVLQATHSLNTSSYESFTDLDAMPDGRLLLVNRTRSALEIRETTGQLVTRWPVRGVPLRAAPTMDGGAFAITREGWVWKLDQNGTIEAWWDAAADAIGRRGILGDIAIDDAGRVLVTDAQADEIRVYAADPEAAPALPPSGDGCLFVRDKWAAPRRIPLGSTVDVTLTVSGECLEEGRGVDVVLVIDRSGSMRGSKMEGARNAAVAFVGEVDLAVSRVGVALFNVDAMLAMSLTNSAEDVIDAVVGFGEPNGGTDIGEGIDVGLQELQARGRPDAEQILIVMTDGRPEGDVVDADEAADRAKAAGVRVFSIGFGGDADAALMRRIATDTDHYFFAPGAAELSNIYTEIARRITGGIIARTMTITDVIPTNMTLVPGSVAPPATDFTDRVLTWELTNVREAIVLGYTLEPQEIGVWPTNDFAGAEYMDGRDVEGNLVFPVPEVEVVVPPEPIYLPALDRNHCRPKNIFADVGLVIDTSSSMTGDKLAAAKVAARRFIDSLQLPNDRAAVIGFNRDATLASGLTGDRGVLLAAIDSLFVETGTTIDAGMNMASDVLSAGASHGNNPVMILLTDGQNNQGAGPVLQAADRAKSLGITIYTVAFGDLADRALMEQVAGDPRRVFVALDADDLQRIYSEIAGVIPCR